MLTLLAASAFLAGVTGSWSPCGFSMLTTLAPSGNARGRAGSLAGVAAFAPGALLGGVVSFGALAVLGRAVHAGGSTAVLALAAGVAALAALGEASGIRVRPQVRRQVPERWRFVLPLPAAAFGYGVLLGLGWTTYVLTLAVWALFALSFALGDPALGLAAGLAFGAGRALPIVLVAPILDRPLGLRVAEAMAERPGILRGLRTVDGAALVACLIALLPAAGAHAATRVATGADDPSVAPGYLVWHDARGGADVLHAGTIRRLDVRDAAAGGHVIASRGPGGSVEIQRLGGPVKHQTVLIGEHGKLAVSDTQLAWRVVTARGDRIYALAYADAGAHIHRVAATRAPSQLSRPALDGDRIVYATAGPAGSSLRTVNLASGRRLVLAHAVETQYLNPSLSGNRLLFVRTTHCAQALVLRRLGARPVNRVLLHAGPLGTRDEGHEHGYSPQGSEPTKCHPERARARSLLWTTALGPRNAYVVAVRGGRGRLLRVAR